MKAFSQKLSLKEIVSETASFLSTFSKGSLMSVDVMGLRNDVLVSGNESQIYKIFIDLSRSIHWFSAYGMVRFIFFTHDAKRKEDDALIQPMSLPKERYVAFSVRCYKTEDTNDSRVIDRFLRSSALYFGLDVIDDGYVSSLFPRMSFIHYYQGKMIVSAELGLFFTVYFPRSS